MNRKITAYELRRLLAGAASELCTPSLSEAERRSLVTALLDGEQWIREYGLDASAGEKPVSKLEAAVAKARAEGHDLELDPPPVVSSVYRYTCRRCICSVLGNTTVAYGSATEHPCRAPRTVSP